MELKWDRGPSSRVNRVFEQAPITEYSSKPHRFRLEWGPVFYRGRTDGSARVLVIGQDPAADENVARRTLVGTGGQRVQGFLFKLGITKSYVIINSFLYSIKGQFDEEMNEFVDQTEIKNWVNRLLNTLYTRHVQVILAFGQAARHVLDNWPPAVTLKESGVIVNLTHPTARPESTVLQNWNSMIQSTAMKVTPDPDGVVDTSPYGSEFTNEDLKRIPLYDFPFGVPRWMGIGNMAIRWYTQNPPPTFRNNKSTIVFVALEENG